MRARRFNALVFVGILLLTCSFVRGVFAEETPTTAVRVIADYRIDLADFNLGDFRFTTLLNGANYQMRGEGHFSMLGGLIYNWQGTTGSSGKLTNLGPEPAAYALQELCGWQRERATPRVLQRWRRHAGVDASEKETDASPYLQSRKSSLPASSIH